MEDGLKVHKMNKKLYELHELYDKHVPKLLENDSKLLIPPAKCYCGKWFLSLMPVHNSPMYIDLLGTLVMEADRHKVIDRIIATKEGKSFIDYLKHLKRTKEREVEDKKDLDTWLKALKLRGLQ